MLRMTNHTKDIELEIDSADELETYMLENQGDEIELFCTTLALNSLEDYTKYLELDENTRDKLEGYISYHGYSYFNTLDDALNALEEGIGMIVHDVSNDRDLAHKLQHSLEVEEEYLYRVLGCTKEAYDSLSSYIRDEDVAHTLETEFNFYYVNNVGYEVLV